MKYLSPEDVKERYLHLRYISSYERLYAPIDDSREFVEPQEYHARCKCSEGAAWEVYHYPRTSPLIIKARREGARNVFICRAGKAKPFPGTPLGSQKPSSSDYALRISEVVAEEAERVKLYVSLCKAGCFDVVHVVL